MPHPDGARRRDLALAGVLLGLAVLIVVLARRIDPGVETDPLGPGAFPLALGAAIGLCGVLLGGGALLSCRWTAPVAVLAESGPDGETPEAFSPGRLAAAVALTAAYIAAFEPLGYLLATPPYVAALLLVHGAASARAVVTAPVLLTAAFYAAFRFGLLIPVPDGLLERWIPW
ncbi:MAG TPA: tripartite tricarboxylate transporter TctB family protein [Methylomirabilota bacterium]|nr:tripartite tricarboxylate transporter TctB family protein [Methylomirabilota bacterium]